MAETETKEHVKEEKDVGSQKLSAVRGGRESRREQREAELTDELGSRLESLTERAKEFGVKARDFSNERMEKFNSYMGERPVQALLMGFGAGCLIGFLASRRWNEA